MKMLLNDFLELDENELLAVNGGYSSCSSSRSYDSTKYYGGYSGHSSSSNSYNSISSSTSSVSNANYDSTASGGDGDTSSDVGADTNDKLPADFQCDKYAQDLAREKGLNEGDWNPDDLYVQDIYDKYTDFRTGIQLKNNMEETNSHESGYVFYDWDTDKSVDHMEYYEYHGGNTYYIWKTDGISVPQKTKYTISEDSNGHAGVDSAAFFIPLGNK